MIGGLAQGELAVLGTREIGGGPLELLHLGRGRRRRWLPFSRGRRVGPYPDVAFRSCVGRSRTEGDQRIHHVRQALVVDANLFDGLSAGVFVYRANRQNRLALINRIVGEPS